MIWPHFTPHLCLPKPTNLCTSMTSCGRLLTTPSFTRLTACVAYRQADGTPARLLHSACPRADAARTHLTYLHNISHLEHCFLSLTTLIFYPAVERLIPLPYLVLCVCVRVRWLLSCVICSLSLSLSLSPSQITHKANIGLKRL